MPDRASVAEWTALLDRFERDLAGSAEPAPWQPAASPLPDELRDRALRLLDRQHGMIRSLSTERDETAAHLAALQRVPATPADRPAYLDLDG